MWKEERESTLSTAPSSSSHSGVKISIAILHPSNNVSDEIVCTRSHVWLSEGNQEPYEALSYAWDNEITNIHLDGASFPVSTNLDLALKAIRDERQPKRIWVDAICIPQTEEKIAQELPRIRMAFEQARHTYLWLGAASHDSSLAIDHLHWLAWRQHEKDTQGVLKVCWDVLCRTVGLVIWILPMWAGLMVYLMGRVSKTIMHLVCTLVLMCINSRTGWRPSAGQFMENLIFLVIATPVFWLHVTKEIIVLPATITVDPGTVVMSALSSFFERRWFTRTWMVEEVIVAKKATVLCGSQSISWSSLMDACYMIDSIVCSEMARSPYIDCFYHRVEAISSVTGLDDMSPTVVRHRSSLLYLITAFSHLDAFKSIDKIKALLGLSTDQNVVFARDVKSAHVMFAATVKYIVESSNELDVLRACLFRGSLQDLPSWVPDWTVKNIRSVSGMTYHRDPWRLNAEARTPVASFSSDLQRMTVHGITIARLKDLLSVWSYSRSGCFIEFCSELFIQFFSMHKGTIEAILDDKISDNRVVLASTNNTRLFPLLQARSLYFSHWVTHILWLTPGFSRLMNYFAKINLGGFGFFFGILNSAHTEAPQLRHRNRPGLTPRTWEATAARINPEGNNATTISTWYTEGLKGGTPVDPDQNQFKQLETYADGAKAEDLVVMLEGAKLPFIIRQVDEPDRAGEGAVTTAANGKQSRLFKLIGPCGFAGFTGNTILWNRTKKAYEDGEQRLERFTLV